MYISTVLQICDMLSHAVSANYRVALNASIYYADISSDTPLNTPVFRIRLIINANENPLDITMRFFQTAQIQNLFEFEGSSNNTIDISSGDLQTVGNNRIFDTSINLVAHPATEFPDAEDYPVELDLTISLVVLFSSDISTAEINSKGLGYIQGENDESGPQIDNSVEARPLDKIWLDIKINLKNTFTAWLCSTSKAPPVPLYAIIMALLAMPLLWPYGIVVLGYKRTHRCGTVVAPLWLPPLGLWALGQKSPRCHYRPVWYKRTHALIYT